MIRLVHSTEECTLIVRLTRDETPDLFGERSMCLPTHDELLEILGSITDLEIYDQVEFQLLAHDGVFCKYEPLIR